MLVYPVLPRTTCSAPPAIPDSIFSSQQVFAAWMGSAAGRAFLQAERANGWDCYNALKAVHAEQMRWPVQQPIKAQ
jgi:hypothetical protein